MFLLAPLVLTSQDLHFTQFQFAPLTINPALTGAYHGSYRIGGIFRDQYRTVGGQGFQTLDFNIDAPVFRGIRKQDWIGIGIGIDALDQAGGLRYNSTFFRLNGAYHLSFNKEQTRIFTLGFQYNTVGVSIRQLSTQDTRGGNMVSDPDVEAFNAMGMEGKVNSNYSDYVVGLMFNSKGKDSDFKIGVAGARILRPQLRLGNSLERLDFRLTAFGQYTMPITDRTSFTPGFLYQKISSAQEFVVQSQMGYMIRPEKQIKLNGGLGYRLGDALQFLMGADIKDLRVGVAYDMNISSLSPASRTVGGFELAVAYYGKIYKKPKVKPVIVCPRL